VFFPRAITAFNGVPVRLYILEGTALAMGLLLLLGLILLLVRRVTNPLVRSVTSRMDVVLLIILLVSAVTGIGTAIFQRWGSSWYVQTVTPYFWSVVRLNPNVEFMASLPVLTKIHAVTASALVIVFPFTRLVHIVSVPFTYLWRPYQVVMWRRRSRLRQ
jgi:nitrate reductase gamma subunit